MSCPRTGSVASSSSWRLVKLMEMNARASPPCSHYFLLNSASVLTVWPSWLWPTGAVSECSRLTYSRRLVAQKRPVFAATIASEAFSKSSEIFENDGVSLRRSSERVSTLEAEKKRDFFLASYVNAPTGHELRYQRRSELRFRGGCA